MKKRFSDIIFDLDGVIINSEGLHAQAKQIILHRYEIAYPPGIFSEFKGRPDLVFWKYVSEELTNGKYKTKELDAAKREVFFSLAGQMDLVPGALEFVKKAKKVFRMTALVTSATEADLLVSEKKFGLRQWFDVIQTGDDTVKHKPDPEPYLKALEKLRAVPSDTLVIEDSPNGVQAAKSAGCFVIGLTTGFSTRDLTEAGADSITDSFIHLKGLVTDQPPRFPSI